MDTKYKTRTELWSAIVLAIAGIGLVIDALIYYFNGTQSLSQIIWAFNAAHPSAQVFGALINLTLTFLARKNPYIAILGGVETGHLWTV